MTSCPFSIPSWNANVTQIKRTAKGSEACPSTHPPKHPAKSKFIFTRFILTTLSPRTGPGRRRKTEVQTRNRSTSHYVQATVNVLAYCTDSTTIKLLRCASNNPHSTQSEVSTCQLDSIPTTCSPDFCRNLPLRKRRGQISGRLVLPTLTYTLWLATGDFTTSPEIRPDPPSTAL